MSDKTTIPTPEEMALMLFPDESFGLSGLGGAYRVAASQAITAERERVEAARVEQARRTDCHVCHKPIGPEDATGQACSYEAHGLRFGFAAHAGCVTEDRETLAAWCDSEAKDARDSAAGCGSDHDFGCVEQGKAEAFEAMAARLRGAP